MTIRPLASVSSPVIAGTPAATPAPQEPSDRLDVARALLGSDGLEIHPAWSRPAQAAGAPGASSEAVVVGTKDGAVQALDPQTGEPLWSVPVKDLEGTPVVGADGSIYAVSGKHEVLSLAADGTERWRVAFDGWVVGPPAVAPDGTMGLLVKQQGDQVFCLDADTGKTRWNRVLQRPQSMVSRAPVAGADGTLYAFDSADYTLWALDPQRGGQKWKTGVGDLMSAPPTVGEDGTVYVSRAFGDVVALDPANGRMRWKQKLGKSPAAAASPGGPVFVRAEGNRVAALDARDGGVLWQHEIGEAGLSEPAVDSAGNLVVGGSDGVARALDPGTGRPRWTAAPGGDLLRPVAGPDQEVFFSDSSGRIVGLDPRRGMVDAVSEAAAEEERSIQVNGGTVSIGGIDLPIRS